MIFSTNEIQEILNVIEYHHVFTASINLGVDVLSREDRDLLQKNNVDISGLRSNMSSYDKLYYFGRLTGILNDIQSKTISFLDFLQYIKRGQYIPLSTREKFELDIAKRQTYTHLKGLKDRVKTSVESSILKEESKRREEYDKAVKEGLEKGVIDRKSVSSIISDIGHQLDTFKHDWGRIVETESNNIFLLGRAMEYAKKDGDDVLVYKTVYPLACRHCIEKYLTNGIGSKPRVFKLSDLIKNGTNIGKKVRDWVATLLSIHPFCRCLLNRVPPRYVWSEENQRFELPKTIENRVERKSKVKTVVGEKVFWV